MSRAPEGPPPPPVVQRLRVRYAKRDRLRFTSHRDFARAFERAVRRAQLPVAFSAGFTPRPKISYAGAAPTGVASEAEYLEVALAERRAPDAVREALDAALPPGLDIVDVVEASGASLADRIDASRWRLEAGGVDPAVLRHAVDAFLAAGEVTVERLTKDGRRRFDARAAVVTLACTPAGNPPGDGGCAILDLVVRHGTPAVRPDDVLAGLRQVAAGAPPASAVRVTRLAQGLLGADGHLADPFAADHAAAGEVDAAGARPTG